MIPASIARLASVVAAISALVLPGCGSGDSSNLFSGKPPSGAGGGAIAGGGNGTGSGGSVDQGGASGGNTGGASSSGGTAGGGGSITDPGNGGGSPGGSGAGGGAPDSGVGSAIDAGPPVTFPSGGVISAQCAACATANCQSEARACRADQACWDMGVCVTQCIIPLQCAVCFAGPQQARAEFSALQCCTMKGCSMCPSLGGLLACP